MTEPQTNGEARGDASPLYRLASKQGDIIITQGPALARIETKVDDLADDHRRLEATIAKLCDIVAANTATVAELVKIEAGRMLVWAEAWKIFKPLIIALVAAACVAIGTWGVRG